MNKLKEKELLNAIEEIFVGHNIWLIEGKTKQQVIDIFSAGPQKLREKCYQRIVELIKIFFAEEISSGPIKEDISRPVLIEWLQGINQAATSVHDDYVMKATAQLIDELRRYGKIQEYFDGIKAEISALGGVVQLASLWNKDIPDKSWLPTAENINALPEPVRNYIADMQTNADPPSMVADNIIMKDTIKTLEKMLEEKPEPLDLEQKARELFSWSADPRTIKECEDFIREVIKK